MKIIFYPFIFCLMMVVAISCGDKKVEHQVAIAVLSATDGAAKIGEVKFYDIGNEKMRMDMELTMPERAGSTVAVHFHEHGDCGNMGENAHGHWNPTRENHGQWEGAHYHSGDIGNIQLDSKGHGKVSRTTLRWTTIEGDERNIIGKGIIVHGGTDDYKTQPTGNSGPRIGCGVIEVLK
jgi:Cu-Zn family superoxide dismutase